MSHWNAVRVPIITIRTGRSFHKPSEPNVPEKSRNSLAGALSSYPNISPVGIALPIPIFHSRYLSAFKFDTITSARPDN